MNYAKGLVVSLIYATLSVYIRIICAANWSTVVCMSCNYVHK